ncbi:E3 ubiquitin-protein ligase SH3RF1 [Aedes albopictus]|uniref:RING-type E3 ubiquitin transferase n=1 Tax=Aedes albopictus TaxID=7160 RepID=A0ABM1ZZD8_AEDAL|nr:E3 ubiquitin-protein ligase SH3RF1-like [Aedes albopictus]XP_029712751.1 E3 ubiquitin-protein ligase SH3RF1-like [Aedes albopictus]XP_029712752.1 E3 ubiquitin-protein ligase SH3RF1-like [Aedes albopictus]XP_029712753.1 E3 ubiquitin-protein ligase SH3RF1-like [Aedes albopictus]XP_029712754.1 E3 ubiquitin-protein ligase SH3RF1-like [Aedes albopictus]
MDERLLNDLLECSVCLERLDTSSKVLPCQHTFCRKCLEEIVASHQELRCPECRVLVEIKIDELPPNVLLMRILEGMKTAELNNQNTNINKAARTGVGGGGGGNIFNLQLQQQNHPSIAYHHQGSSNAQQQHHQQQQQQQQKNNKNDQLHHHSHQGRIIAGNALDLTKIPHAKAFYDFASSETSDISFKKGDIVILKKKIDHNWCVGEVNGKEGAVPLNHLQVIVPLPYPQCKALYDFSMGPNDEEGCLTFKKGALIHVLRRVDQNWAEGRIADKIGIFPISFVEMNSLAKHMMESALKHILASASNNRTVPPTPFDLNASDTTSSSVTTSPNTSNSTTSSNSSTAPSSPTSQFLTTTTATSTAAAGGNSSSKEHHKEKRHSLTTFVASSSTGVANVGGPLNHPNRHSAEILSTPDADRQQQPASTATQATSTEHTPQSTGRPDMLNYQKSNAAKAAASQHYQHQQPQLPATYIALYPYKPQKPDELELKKGSIYYVTERCQDGWFKGANRQQKSGVFPGNYVTVYKGREAGHSSRNTNNQGPSSGATASTTATCGVQNPSSNLAQITLPALPPRDATIANNSGAPAGGAGPVWTKQSQQPQQHPNQSGYIDSLFGRKSGSAPPDRNTAAAAGPDPLQTGVAAAAAAAAAQPVKEKKDSSAVSLMKRLTNIKRSKSPTSSNGGTTNPAYSMDNPVFEDSSLPGGAPIKSNLQQIINPVHVRSGSCPSQLLQNLPVDVLLAHGRENVPYMYGSQRVKPHKERPSMHGLKSEASGKTSSKHAAAVAAGSAHHQQQQHQLLQQQSHEAPASTSSASHAPKQSHPYHRKSQSLDASAIISHMNGTPSKSKAHSQAVRERFKCIVPYPPNSEYELELRVGDVVLVHKKRDNGWYKGTHQRSGKTGLFPASFVEPADK